MPKEHLKKITLLVPEDLLRRATEATGQGITATVRSRLKLLTVHPGERYKWTR